MLRDLRYQMGVTWRSRGFWLSTLALLLISMIIGFNQASQDAPLAEDLVWRDVLFGATANIGYLAILVASIAIAGADVRQNSIAYRLAVARSRTSLLVSWLCTGMSVSIVFALSTIIGSSVGLILRRGVSELDSLPENTVLLQTAAFALVTSCLIAAIGAALAVALRTDLAGLVVSILWIAVVENLLADASDGLAAFLPWRSARDVLIVSSAPTSIPEALSTVFGWALLLCIVAPVRFWSRDF